MIKNRAGPCRGHARDGPYLLIKVRGDPGMFRHARDNPVCKVQIYSMLIGLQKLKGERYGQLSMNEN